MKIKAVCDITGLTDRTVRFYIEEGLICPACTKNYLGRRSYEFSPVDVSQLHKICTLRQYDFSIEEMRQIMHAPEKSPEILAAVRQRAEQVVEKAQSTLSILRQLDLEREYTFSELASSLEHISHQEPEPFEYEDSQPVRTAVHIITTIVTYMITGLSVTCCTSIAIYKLWHYQYPTLDFPLLGQAVLSLLPSAGVIVISRFRFPKRWLIKGILLILSVILLPYSLILTASSIPSSETSRIYYYRELDATCTASRDPFLAELFPPWPQYYQTVKLPDGTWDDIDANPRYHYEYRYEYHSIYAQWQLGQEEFDTEVERVKALFLAHTPSEGGNGLQHFFTIQKGSYTCLIGAYRIGSEDPFEDATRAYSYYLFAYDPQSRTVRYSCDDCDYDNPKQPYFLSLEW